MAQRVQPLRIVREGIDRQRRRVPTASGQHGDGGQDPYAAHDRQFP